MEPFFFFFTRQYHLSTSRWHHSTYKCSVWKPNILLFYIIDSEFKVKGIIRCKIPFSSCLNKGVCTHPPYNDKKSTQCFLIPFLKSGCSEVPVRMM